MKIIASLFIFIIFNTSLNAYSFPIPKENKATYDIIRKNKVIGNLETEFIRNEKYLIINTKINIKVKVLFFPAYKFNQSSKEIWLDNEFIEFDGHTKFEDNREYYVKGKDSDSNFVASGMDGDLILDKNILPLNYWSKDILLEKEVFDTQKGIVRKISVQKLDDEILKINNQEIKTEKYLLDATTNPKDKGPFPQYTIWYDKKNELIKMKFTNWKDKKEVLTIRNNWDK